jgi:ferrochelatase
MTEAAALVAADVAPDLPWELVWQSRSGTPSIPWLEPDINDRLRALAAEGVTSVVVSPIGFISDHLEVVWDLDNEAAGTARELGLDFARAATPGTHPEFVEMVVELVRERLYAGGPAPRRLGELACWDTCAATCCAAPVRPADRSVAIQPA